jgi:carboxypeptidase C (cathepsin A)
VADETTESPTTDAHPTPSDDLVTTAHTVDTPSGTLAYTATAGRIVLRKEVLEDSTFKGHRPTAEVFLTAYTLDGADPAERPVVFAFNGGPGSSSVWLHLGLLGPRRVLMGDAGDLLPPPYRLTENAETLLAVADLVFIDPVSTGYSRPVQDGSPKDFHGFTGDLESVGEVIRLWTTRNDRWLSPKLLAGESYGTLRAAALAEHLQTRYGMYLNGIALISAVLDMGTIRFTEGNETPYPLFLPTYAAIAHYHGLHGDRPLRDVLEEAERYAAGRYPWALAQGSRLDDETRAEHVTRIARLSGLSQDYVDRADLRIEHLRFFTELLRSRRLTVGRLDGRFTGWDPDNAGERMEHDPSYLAIHGPYAAAFNHYVRSTLEYRNDLPYEILTDRVQPWSYEEFQGRGVSVAGKLAQAMRANRHLKVHIACGYHDGATPYHAAEYTVAHLRIPAELRDNISFAYYEAGHMMYVHEPSRVQQSADLAAWVQEACGTG